MNDSDRGDPGIDRPRTVEPEPGLEVLQVSHTARHELGPDE